MKIAIRTFRPEDVDLLPAAFRTWPKPRELFVTTPTGSRPAVLSYSSPN
jgi:hypothetical protein